MQTINFDTDLEYDYEKGLEYYQGAPFTGKAITYYPDGVISSELSFKDGLRDGIQKYWYASGKPEAIRYLLKGGGHGTNQEWYESGELKSEQVIEFGVTLRRTEWNIKGEVKDSYVLKESDPLYAILKIRREKWK